VRAEFEISFLSVNVSLTLHHLVQHVLRLLSVEMSERWRTRAMTAWRVRSYYAWTFLSLEESKSFLLPACYAMAYYGEVGEVVQSCNGELGEALRLLNIRFVSNCLTPTLPD